MNIEADRALSRIIKRQPSFRNCHQTSDARAVACEFAVWVLEQARAFTIDEIDAFAEYLRR